MSTARSILKLRSLYDDATAWISRAQNRQIVYQESLDEVRRLKTLSTLMTDLRSLALWYGSSAVQESLAGGDVDGNLSTAHCAAMLEIEGAVQSFEADSRKRRQFRLWRSATSLHGCASFAGGWISDARRVAALLDLHHESGLLSDDQRIVAVFFRGILNALEGNPADLRTRVLPVPYTTLLDRWDDKSSELAPILEDACEERLAWAEDEHQLTPDGELSNHFYAVYPAELLAFQRLRVLRGQEPVVIEHPLMTMPLGVLRDSSNCKPLEPALSSLLASARS